MPLFTLPFSDDDPLFSVSFHPEKPQFVCGTASGRVTAYTYKTQTQSSESGTQDSVVELWSTKRHKGSCRTITYSQSGVSIVSTGSDGVVKKCDANTGKVTHKAKLDAGGAAIAINEEYLVVGDESGSVHVLKQSDLGLHRKYKLEGVESVSAICPLAAVNKHTFAVAAEMYIIRIDVRKDEVSSKSEDQEDEILSGCIASESRSAWGMSEGVVTIWNNKGLSDQQHRVKLTKDGSVDSILAGELDDHAIAGTSDGWVVEIDTIAAKILHKARHNSEITDDEVAYLDYDFEYRLVSGSMNLLKVWNEDELKVQQESTAAEAGKKRGAKKQKSKNAKKLNASTPAFDDLMG